jgi:hypothetical protein
MTENQRGSWLAAALEVDVCLTVRGVDFDQRHATLAAAAV